MPGALVLCEFATLNGGEQSLLSVLPHLVAAGWTFDCWCPADGPLAERLAALGVQVISSGDGLPRAATLAERRERMRQVLAASQYDLVHANSLAMGRLSGPVVGAAGIPSLAHLRDIVGLSAAAIGDLNGHSRILAVSEATRTHHTAQGLSAAKTFVLHNGVDLQTYSPTPATGYLYRELKTEPHARLIGIIGQIILRKGQDTALAAAAQVLAARPDVQVVVVGARHSEKPETVEYERRLHAIVAEAGLQNRVHYLGTRDDLPRLLPELTMLLHTARQEPLGRVLLEAAACGVPVVATEVGGTREIFPCGRNEGALLIPVDDAAAARDACLEILDDQSLTKSLRAAARRRIEAAFNVETTAAGLLAHYAEVSSCRGLS